MSDTPRTDALFKQATVTTIDYAIGSCFDLARTLEKELCSARERILCLERELFFWMERLSKCSREMERLKRVGENNGRAILTKKAVEEIRASGLKNTLLAKIYGVSESTIRAAKNGDTWAK